MAKDDLAASYAQAILEEAVQGWNKSLQAVNASVQKAGLTEQLDNSATLFAKKEELLRRVIPAEAKPETQNFLKLLASKNHVHLLPQIIAEFDRRIQHGPQGHAAQITSAVELSADERRALESKLRAKFGAETAFEYSLNPDLIGGVLVRIGDKILDGSVAGKLAALKDKLTS